MHYLLTIVHDKFDIFLKLVKIEDQIGNAIAFFAGYAFFANIYNNLVFALASTALNLMATNTLNQCTDVEIDKINKPARPIPSGKISLSSACMLFIILYGLSLLLSYFVNHEFMLLTIFATLLGLGYSIKPFKFKDRLFISNLSISIGYGLLNFLLGWSANKPIEDAPLSMLLFLTLFDLFANISKDYRDIEGDKAYGVRTLPIVLGIKRSIILQFIGLYSISIISIFTISKPFFIAPIICIVISILANIDAINSKYIAFYKKMMLSYIVVRVSIIFLAIL